MTEALDRTAITADLLADRSDDLLVVAGLGGCNYDVGLVGDHPLNFGLWGGMGQAAVIGLGLAMTRPDKRVLVITGDGEMLMGMGSLATIADQAPLNLAIVVMDNELYAETGRQPTHTAGRADLAKIAEGAGIGNVLTVAAPDQLTDLREMALSAPGPAFAVVKVPGQGIEMDPDKLPPRDGGFMSNRFRSTLLGTYEAVLKV